MSQRWSAIFCGMGVWGVEPIGRVRLSYLFFLILGAVIYFGYGIRFSNLELEYVRPATYKVGLDLDADFEPNFSEKPKTTKGGYEQFENDE